MKYKVNWIFLASFAAFLFFTTSFLTERSLLMYVLRLGAICLVIFAIVWNLVHK